MSAEKLHAINTDPVLRPTQGKKKVRIQHSHSFKDDDFRDSWQRVAKSGERGHARAGQGRVTDTLCQLS